MQRRERREASFQMQMLFVCLFFFFFFVHSFTVPEAGVRIPLEAKSTISAQCFGYLANREPNISRKY